MRTILVALGIVASVACAKGAGSIDDETDGSGAASAGGASSTSSGLGAGTTSSSGQGAGGQGGSSSSSSASSSASSSSTSSSSTSSSSTSSSSTSSSSTSSSSTSSSSASSSSASSSSASSSSSSGTCNPLNPLPVCGPSNHCVPQPNGIPLCNAPTGGGTQYSFCNSSADCAPPYECVQTPYLTVYCMQWCAGDQDCPGYLFDYCNALNPAVYVGPVEWGVCYDGWP